MSRWIFPEEGPEQNEQKKKQAEIKKNEILESVYRSFQGCVRYGIGILGIGMDVVPNLPNKVSGTGNGGGIQRRHASVRTVPNKPLNIFPPK